MKLVLLGAVLVIISGCASTIPRQISKAPDPAINIPGAITDIEQARGESVRWGGEVVTVENRANDTWIEIVGRPLTANGRPTDGRSRGRFWATFSGFKEPSDFPKGQQLTVYGSIIGSASEQIGEYPYTYAVIDVEQFHRWPALQRHDYDSPYYYTGYRHHPFYRHRSSIFFHSRFHRSSRFHRASRIHRSW